MRLFKLIISVAFITTLGVLYVHQQVELVKLSYAIENKAKRLKVILDCKEALGYNIDNLEAPSRLESILLARKIDVAFPKRVNVVKAARYASGPKGSGYFKEIGPEKRLNIFGFFDFLNPRAEAQAKEK